MTDRPMLGHVQTPSRWSQNTTWHIQVHTACIALPKGRLKYLDSENKKVPTIPWMLKTCQHTFIETTKNSDHSFLSLEATKVTSILSDYYTSISLRKTSLLPLPSIHFQTFFSLKKRFVQFSQRIFVARALLAAPLECQTIPKVLLDRATQVLNVFPPEG